MAFDRTKTALVSASLLLVASLLGPAVAAADIKRPGDHVHYGVELEPHLILQWASELGYDEGFGFGARGSVVLVDNGPIPMLNNTLAITFGMDLTFFDDEYYGRVDRDAFQMWLPVAAQWNFYFTSEFALFPELGVALRYFDGDECVSVSAVGACRGDDDVDLEPVFWFGGRYVFNDMMALTIRLGYPSINFGASFFL